METKDAASVPSTPASPGTPGAPLFGGRYKPEKRRTNGARFLSCCKCFSIELWALQEGTLPTAACSTPPPSVSIARKVGAEFIGTLILISAGTATAIVNQKTQGAETLLGCAVSTGLAVMIVILATGHISGAHLNPSITIAFAALKHFPWKHVPMYVCAQVMASLCAAFALKGVFHPVMNGGVTVPSGGYGQACALEFVISFNLMFVVTAVATDTRAVCLPSSANPNLILHGKKQENEMALPKACPPNILQVGELAAIAVGATVMLNILIAGETTGGSMNPVRTLGPAIAANNFKAIWVYLTAPILGALFGAGVYSAVKLPEEDGHTHENPPTR
ncbi:Major intrinsic protein [Dillenia turbinata]|uniref:Major intrinsic protein n=1 Tax=Dillenia turbinata TaxID=194707 RepID=A0AAN8UGM0_9MAGN